MRTLFALLAVALLAVASAFAQAVPPDPTGASAATLDEYVKLIKGDLTARRDSAMSAVLEMNETEKKAFVPLRQAYDKELADLGKRRLAAIDDYMKVHTKLNATNSAELAERFFKLDEERMALRKKYFGLMSAQVSPVVAVQFMQLERQFETMGDVKLATKMPLAVK